MYHATSKPDHTAHVAEYYETIGDVYAEISGTLAYPLAHIMDRAYEYALRANLAAWSPYDEAMLAAFGAKREPG
jgi:hypothetical protein